MDNEFVIINENGEYITGRTNKPFSKEHRDAFPLWDEQAANKVLAELSKEYPNLKIQHCQPPWRKPAVS